MSLWWYKVARFSDSVLALLEEGKGRRCMFVQGGQQLLAGCYGKGAMAALSQEVEKPCEFKDMPPPSSDNRLFTKGRSFFADLRCILEEGADAVD